ncbi:META domain-containing protein [Flavobacterium sp.]|uniref:META domain-containing protein n=1 Tax=Flavobacterium sp. TaxID=239 RepID=UPI0037507376
MNKLTFIILFSIITFSCNSKKEVSETPTQNINRVWMLTEFKNFEKQFLVASKAQLNLTNSKTATANMGCNGISSKYIIKSNSEITFSDGMRTEMACGEMKLEDNFLEILPKINSFKIEVHKLTLTSKDGQKMIFAAQDWD